jgi:hypothetical protein
MELSKRPFKLVKTISGSLFNEGGFGTGDCPGMTSTVPRWFVDLRNEGKIRVNCMSYATIYLRNDGHLFEITAKTLGTRPLEDALSSQEDYDRFLDNVFKKGRFRSRGPSDWRELWECCEYVPDVDCSDRSNLWRVAASARRTGRFMYTAQRKAAKDYLEGPEEDIPWIYAPEFDQFTVEYEKRYREKVDRLSAERQERQEYSRTHAKKVEFNFNDFAVVSTVIDHHKVLGIPRSACPREIKSAYWKLAKQCHPDLNPGDKEAEQKFKKLAISYQELMRYI